MGTSVQGDPVSQDSESITHGVTCIFCGLPTPVHTSSQKSLGGYYPEASGRVTLVRCEVCGKEAPYLAHEIGEFVERFRARNASYAMEKEYGI